MGILCFLIAFSATAIGSMSGLGGGVIIKPLLDRLAGARISLQEIGLLSSLTVFAMALFSTWKGTRKGVALDLSLFVPLGAASSIGGLAGNYAFSRTAALAGEELCRGIQSGLMLALMSGVLTLYLLGERIEPLRIRSRALTALAGFGLGALSAYLGIGGGPVNVVALKLLFGFREREQVFGSLFIILFAQGSKLLSSLLAGPLFSNALFPILMVAGGLLGAQTGSTLALRLPPERIRTVFTLATALVILLSAGNLLFTP